MVNRWLVTVLAMVALTIGAVGCGSNAVPDGGDVRMDSQAGPISAIAITPATATITVGDATPLQLTARGTFAGMMRDLAQGEVTWRSSDEAIARVNAMGQVTAVARGQVTITATSTMNTMISGTAMITVMGSNAVEAITITPGMATVNINQTQAFTAIVRRMNGTSEDLTSQVMWSSSNTAVATVTGGTARGVAPGTTMITATFMGITSNAATLTVNDRRPVSIALTPVTGTIRAGSTETVALTATVTFDDMTTRNVTQEAMWSSSAATIAAVSNTMGMRGVVSAAGNTIGMATITAVYMGVTSAPAVINVIENSTVTSCAITPSPTTVNAGATVQLTATATFADMRTGDITTRATWTSAAAGTATVGANTGLVRGVAAGNTMITAAFMNTGAGGTTVMCSGMVTVSEAMLVRIEVSPPTHTMSIGSMQTFTAQGVYADMTTRPLTTGVTWSTTDSMIATITAAGVAQGLRAGTVTVRAEVGSIRGEATLVINPATPTRLTLMPADPRIPVRGTQQLRAIATLSDGTTEDVTSAVASWVSSMPTVAAVDGAGLVTGQAAGGPVTITATYRMITGSTTVTVTGAFLESIAVTASATTTPLGVNQTFTATGRFSDGSVRDLTNDTNLTWSSTMTGIATISNAAGERGLARPVAEGATNIVATYVDSMRTVASTPVLFTVVPATLQRIELEPATGVTVDPTFTAQVRAFGVYSDGVRREITENADIVWSTVNTATATVSITPGTRGVVTGVAMGTTEVRAALAGQTASAPVTVTNRTLVSMSIAPSNATIRIGTPGVTYTVTGTFSSGAPQDITSQVTFSSNDPARIGFEGNRAFAVAGATPGPNPPAAPITITATRGAITATATARVAPIATVTTVVVSVVDAAGAPLSTIPVGFTGRATACLISNDGVNPPTDCEPTTAVVFTVTDPTRARVDNAAASYGVVTGLAPTTSATDVRIVATFTPSGGTPVSGQSGNIRITDCQFGAIQIRNARTGAIGSDGSTINRGDDENFRLDGLYAASGSANCPAASAPVGATTYDLSRLADVMWTSSNTAVAQITSTADGATVFVPTTAPTDATAELTARWRTLTAAVHPITTSGLCVRSIAFEATSQDVTLPGGATAVTRRLVVNGTRSDGTAAGDLVADVSFSAPGGLNLTTVNDPGASPYPLVAGTINAPPGTGSAAGSYTVTATLSTDDGACPGITAATTRVTIVTPAIESITIVDPSNPFNVGRGETGIRLRALARYVGLTEQFDITDRANWATTNPDVSILSGGPAGGTMSVDSDAAEGTAVITAQYGGQTGSTTATIITRTLQRVEVAVDPSSLGCEFDSTGIAYPVNVRVPLVVTAFYSDSPAGVTVTNSATFAVTGSTFTIDPTTRIGTTSGSGQSTVRATFGGVTSTGLIIRTVPSTLNTVTVSRVGGGSTIPLGGTAQFQAIGQFTGMPGAATETVTCDITHSTAWSITATTADRFVFDASRPGFGTATSSPANAGAFTVNASRESVLGTLNQNVSGACPVRIRFQPATGVTTARGTTLTRELWADYSDGTEAVLSGAGVVYAAAPTGVVSVSNEGLNGVGIDATTGTTGMTTVTATYTPGSAGAVSCTGSPTETLTATLPVTVTAATVTSLDVVCTTFVMSPYGPNLRNWGVGADPSIPVGFTQQCQAFAVFSDSPSAVNVTDMATWTSSRPSNASVVASGTTGGLVTALAPTTAAAPAVITATFSGQSDTFNFNVNSAAVQSVSVFLSNPAAYNSTPVGFAEQYEADAVLRIGTMGLALTYRVTDLATWISRAPSIATVNNRGLVTGVSPGSAQIDATFGTGTGPTQTGSIVHTVNGFNLVRVETQDPGGNVGWFPTNPRGTLNRGLTAQFNAIAAYCAGAEGSSPCQYRLVTEAASWRTENPAVATVSDAAGSRGTVRAVEVGTTRVFATYQGVTGAYDPGLRVTGNCVNGLTFTARTGTQDVSGRSIPIGAAVTWNVLATYSDLSTPTDVTEDAIYTILPATTAAILPPGDDRITTNPTDDGAVSIRVSLGSGFCGASSPTSTLNFTVEDATPTAINVPGTLRGFVGEELTIPLSITFGSLGTFSMNGWNGFAGGDPRLVINSSNDSIFEFDTLTSGGARFDARGVGTAVATVTYNHPSASVAGSTTVTIGSAVPETIAAQGYNMRLAAGECRLPSEDDSWLNPSGGDTWVAPANSVTRVRARRILTDSSPGTYIEECSAYTIASGASTTSVGSSLECLPGRGIFVRTGTAGTVTINITDPVNASVTATAITLTVLPSTPTAIEIQSIDPRVTPRGVPVDLPLIGTYDVTGPGAGTFQYCISDSATWTSSNTAIANVTTGIGGGDVTTNSVGVATITASIPGAAAGTTVRDDVRIDVQDIALERVFLRPATVSVGVNGTAQIRAWARFTDGIDREITSQAVFTEATPAGGAISIVDPVRSPGLVRGIAAGSEVVSACYSYNGGTAVCTNGTAGRENSTVTVTSP